MVSDYVSLRSEVINQNPVHFQSLAIQQSWLENVRVGYDHLSGVSQFIPCAEANRGQYGKEVGAFTQLIVSGVPACESVLIGESVVGFDIERIDGFLVSPHPNAVGGPKLSRILDILNIGHWVFVKVFLCHRAEISPGCQRHDYVAREWRPCRGIVELARYQTLRSPRISRNACGICRGSKFGVGIRYPVVADSAGAKSVHAEGRKIPSSRALCRHGGCKLSGDQIALTEIIAKEEKPVLDDRPADRSPEFVNVCDCLRQKGFSLRWRVAS